MEPVSFPASQPIGAVFDRGGTPDLGIIFEPQIFDPIIGLAGLALLPVLYRKLKARRAADTCAYR